MDELPISILKRGFNFMPTGIYKRLKPRPEEHCRRISEALKGKHHTKETRKKMRESHLGRKHWNWKGDEAGKTAMHKWVYQQKGKPKVCEGCGATSKERRLAWANKDHKYRRNLDDYLSFCYSCHKIYDLKNNF